MAGAIALGVATMPASAQTSRQLQPCDRQCLIDTGEAVLQAMVNGNPKVDPIHPDARYTENGQELKMPDGLWRTLSSAGSYRLRVADPETGMLSIFSTMEENGAPLILATRIKVRDRMGTEIEATVARRDSAISAGASAGMQPRPNDLKTRPEFDQILPPEQRSSRAKLIEIANLYFMSLENNDGKKHIPPFDKDCHRIENGFATTNQPKASPGATPSPLNFSCHDAFALGYYREDTRLRGMRFLAVDEERGLVFVNGFFDHDAALRNYKLNDGREVTVSRTAPWTWMISEVFKIRNGKIWQVEAVLLSVPYGLKSNWDNGFKMPSFQEEIERNQQ
jgi:hypothetical protein